MKKYRVIISGGGTGGHIFPAIAIANAIQKKNKNIEFLFIGSKGRMEMEKVPESGYKIKGLWISGFQRKLSLRNLIFPIKLFFSQLSAFRIIYTFRPDLVIGTGGYASGPILFAACIKKIPTLIQEQNSYPGITNKILSRYVNKICVAYDKMDRFFSKDKTILTGNPIRKDIVNFKDKKKLACNLFSINKKNQTVLVVGGSLGAKTINTAIFNSLKIFKENQINLIWQTGSSFIALAEERIKEIESTKISAHKFIRRMDLAYSVADIIISRAGAIAISELCCVGKPVILVPSPNVSENHQFKNAQSLVNKNAAVLVEDVQANRKLVTSLLSLVKDKKRQRELSFNIKKIAVTNAAETISEMAIKMIKK